MALARLYLRGNQTVRAGATVASLAPAMTVYAAILLSQVANAAGLLAPYFGWYALGLVLVLVVTAAHFVIFIAHAVTAWLDRG
jgi:hypothetical protein